MKPNENTTAVVAFFVTGLSGCNPVPGMIGQITVQPKHGTAVVTGGTYTTPGCPGVSFPGVEADYTWTDAAGLPGSGSDAFHVHFIGPPGHAQTVDYDIYIAVGSPTKLLGNCAPCDQDRQSSGTGIAGQTFVGDPINPATGNLFEQVTDYTTAGPNPLAFTRYYNSQGSVTSLATNLVSRAVPAAGARWRNTYDRYVSILNPSVAAVERSSGQILSFFSNGTAWASQTDVDGTLFKSGNTWTVTDSEDTVETFSQIALGTLETSMARLTSIRKRNGYTQTLSYNGIGQLTSVTDSYGRALKFAYNANGTLATVTTPDNTVITYGYTAQGSGTNLTSVTYPTTPPSTITYLYENARLPNALTGIIDANGNRYATWTYDTSGRATGSQLGAGANAELTSLSYNANGAATVTNALGLAETYTFTTLQFVPKVAQISRAATSTTTAMTRSFTYDANGFLASQTDWNGNKTSYVNNARGLPTTISEAVGKSEARTTTIAYDASFPHLPATVITPGITTSFTYDKSGNLLTRTLTDTTKATMPYSTKGQARTWTFTYDETGHVLTAKDPRGGVTGFAYEGGAATGITNALNQSLTDESHSPGGYPLTVKDPNGVVTTLTYDGQMRVITSATATGAGTLTTQYSYRFGNLLEKMTRPDGSSLIVSYDSALRPAKLLDALGNSVVYTLSALGNPTQINTYDAHATLTRNHAASFDMLGRMLTDVGGMGQTSTYTYDNNGNALTVTDSLKHKTSNAFDALNRLTSVTDAIGGITQFTYDAHDRPLTVTDPNGNTTTYVYDGFGEMIQQSSPDSGITIYRYDADGNLASKTDAANNVTDYGYDLLDRIQAVSYPSDPSLNVTYRYDESGHGFGVGRLTSLTDAAGSLSRSYDELGNMLSEQRTASGGQRLTTSYGYDKASRIASITYSSGTKISYSRDAGGNISAMGFDAPNSNIKQVLSQVTHLPFGPVGALSYFNGDEDRFTYDLDYRLTTLTSTPSSKAPTGYAVPINWTYGYDAANNVTSITDKLPHPRGQSFGYDALNRLTSAVGPNWTVGWNYDHNGNLATRTEGGTPAYSYEPDTNRLRELGWSSSNPPATSTWSIGNSATGNIISVIQNDTRNGVADKPLQLLQATYSVANRLAAASGVNLRDGRAFSISSMRYDAFGRRFSKNDASGSTTIFTYDQSSNLIEENTNTKITDYIYLDGVNVGNWEPGQPHLYAIHTDRLGTPLIARDEQGGTAWKAFPAPYGVMNLDREVQLTSGPVTQNLRFPGQYFDSESGIHYNMFRDYIPGWFDRYMESDPIGLVGGINAYRYAKNNPIRFRDVNGLCPCQDEKSFAERFEEGRERAEESLISDVLADLVHLNPAMKWSLTEGANMLGATAYALANESDEKIDNALDLPSNKLLFSLIGVDSNRAHQLAPPPTPAQVWERDFNGLKVCTFSSPSNP